ncbi:MAG TPA: hypothetical protein VFN61_15405 [Acidimicrobiales bacterium]|nr:hypothetical protein [Acidimicrobiales bacterium]
MLRVGGCRLRSCLEALGPWGLLAGKDRTLVRRRELFVGPRLRVRQATGARLRASATLLAVSVVVGAIVSAALAAGTGFIVQALLQAVKSGG